MSDWKTNQGPFAVNKTNSANYQNQGPFECEYTPSQEYNDGDKITTREDPVWSMDDFTGVKVTETHTPCKYISKGPYQERYIPPTWYEELGLTPGTLYAAGDNDSGEFGRGNLTSENYLTLIPGKEDWVLVEPSSYWSAALDVDGYLWTTGSNSFGCLVQGDLTDRRTWTRVEDVFGNPLGPFKYLSTGNRNIAVIHEYTGFVMTGGRNTHGECGIGTKTTVETSLVNEISYIPCRKVAAGAYGVMVFLSTAGGLYLSGDAKSGILGLFGDKTTLTQDYQAQGGWLDIAFNGYTCFAKRPTFTGGYQWYFTGRNTDGEAGVGNNTSKSTWTLVIQASKFTKISSGYTGGTDGIHSVAIDEDGKAFATGCNSDGQLGQGNTTDRNTWVQIGSETNWVDCYAGNLYTLLRNSNKEIWGCGKGGRETSGAGGVNLELCQQGVGGALDADDFDSVFSNEITHVIFGIKGS